jgi:hypothetical protein
MRSMGVVQLLGLDRDASTVEAVDWILFFSTRFIGQEETGPVAIHLLTGSS